MHELSLAGGILRVLEQTRERDPFERITQLRLEVGVLAGVEIESLRFALSSIAANTILAGASIEIDQP
jgi:hydrogenase nickel incorporation protein HypA/HybF